MDDEICLSAKSCGNHNRNGGRQQPQRDSCGCAIGDAFIAVQCQSDKKACPSHHNNNRGSLLETTTETVFSDYFGERTKTTTVDSWQDSVAKAKFWELLFLCTVTAFCTALDDDEITDANRSMQEFLSFDTPRIIEERRNESHHLYERAFMHFSRLATTQLKSLFPRSFLTTTLLEKPAVRGGIESDASRQPAADTTFLRCNFHLLVHGLLTEVLSMNSVKDRPFVKIKEENIDDDSVYTTHFPFYEENNNNSTSPNQIDQRRERDMKSSPTEIFYFFFFLIKIFSCYRFLRFVSDR